MANYENILKDEKDNLKIKVYPYRLIYSDKNIEMIRAFSTTVLSISNKKYTLDGNTYDPFEHLEKDEKGNSFFEIIPSSTISTMTDISQSTSNVGLEVINEERVVGITEDKYAPTAFLHREKLYNKGWVDFFTIGKPLNIVDFNKDEQSVYFSESFTTSMDLPIEQIAVLEHKVAELMNLSEIVFLNIKGFEKTYQNSRFVFSLEQHQSNQEKMNITIPEHGLLGKITAKARVNSPIIENKEVEITLKDGNASDIKHSLMTLTPVGVNNKVVMYSHWLDANRTMAFVKAKQYIATGNLKDLFKTTNAEFTGWSQTELDDMYKSILGMLELTYAYSINFTGYRITDASSVNYGKVDVNITINGKSANELADKNPQGAVDGMIESWKAKYPIQAQSSGFKFVMEIIAMMSDYISSTYAIGGGMNDFHKLHLPWYFEPQTAVAKGLANATTDFNVLLKSKYFTLTGNDPLLLQDEIKVISDYFAQDINGWISQPEIPPVLQSLNRFSRPVNVDILSDNDLKYPFFISYKNSDVLEKLFGEIESTTTPPGWNDEGIQRNFSKKYVVVTEDNDADDMRDVMEKRYGLPSDIANKIANNTLLSGTEPTLAQLIKVQPNQRVKAGSISGATYTRKDTLFGLGDGDTEGFSDIVLQFNYELEINGSITIKSIKNKGTMYDKRAWEIVAQNLIDNSTNKFELDMSVNVDKKISPYYFNEVNISGVWINFANIDINGIIYDIETFASSDETIANHTILFA